MKSENKEALLSKGIHTIEEDHASGKGTLERETQLVDLVGPIPIITV